MAKFPHHPRYLPIIKWQSWEQKALENVDATLIPRMHPCIEVRASRQHTNLLNRMKDVWPYDAFVDYSNPAGALTPVRQKELMDFARHAVANGLSASPVLGPDHLAAMGPQFLAVAAALPSVAIRLRLNALEVPQQKLQQAQQAFGTLQAAGIPSPLIVDLGVSPKDWSAAEIASFTHGLRQLAGIGYQSMHLVSGAYPASLAAVKTGVANFKRSDWGFWKDVNTHAADLRIGFGDYGTLSPQWTEDILELRANRIAIRYTRDDNWLILRAGGKTTQDSIAISQILVNGYPQDFKGAPYSFGDLLLAERADPAHPIKKKRCGHYHITEAWSHHIAYVLQEQY
ncbi:MULTISPECIES: beta family protein [Pseudomonas]|uniref:beta family protein n=1 Tax=Pseudomonas TaxID=286 RepID=UPI00053DF8C6|nr:MULTISPECIES: hypothetical protein [Pseudomonas]ELL0594208.1 hypothetical protein [Pseudomonas aeruginosa]EMB4856974.1 hypothetical protein [Pseudomonas aeruginosa]KSC42395.1 hypothetical protein AO881_09140 [Pseudomonas aeruginosa]MBG6720652.1 hypothetical protein [Pseudomonas aeruginosa]MBI7471385.1 hypothetical protein [Pseudomonas aeruginosa]